MDGVQKNSIVIIYLHNEHVSVARLFGDHLLLRDFEPYGITSIDVNVVITVAMVILLKDLG